jgi:hypothetical protein
VKIGDLLKGYLSLAEVGQQYGKNESSICNIQNEEHKTRSRFW